MVHPSTRSSPNAGILEGSPRPHTPAPNSVVPSIIKSSGRLGPTALGFLFHILPTQTFLFTSFLNEVALIYQRYHGCILWINRERECRNILNGALAPIHRSGLESLCHTDWFSDTKWAVNNKKDKDKDKDKDRPQPCKWHLRHSSFYLQKCVESNTSYYVVGRLSEWVCGVEWSWVTLIEVDRTGPDWTVRYCYCVTYTLYRLKI